MDKIKEVFSNNKDELENKKVSTQSVDQEGSKSDAPSMQAFNVRGGPQQIPDGVTVQQEGDKASRDAQAKEWNKQ
jgi:hypothetical protein